MSEPPGYYEGIDPSIKSFPGESPNQPPGLGRIGDLFRTASEAILKKVVLAIVGVILPGPLIDQLSHWAQILLPDQILQPIRDLIAIIVSVLDLIPLIGPPVGDALEYFGQIFGVIKDKTDTAQATGDAAQVSADNANVGVARLEAQAAGGAVPGGMVFNDTFDVYNGSSLGSAYDQAYAGGAGGTLYSDGNFAVLAPTGAGVRLAVARIITAQTVTDNQGIQFVQDTHLGDTLDDCELYLFLRMNAARTHYLQAKIRWYGVEIGKVIAGAYTTLATASNTTAAGDRWTFKAGTDPGAGGSAREFVLYRNTGEALRVTDSGTLSSMGSGFRYPGFGLLSGQAFVPPFFSQVIAPPNIQSVSAYDRLPSN